MALQLQDMLMRLQPLSPLSPAGSGSDKSLERKRLQLMREQFEETKRQNAEDKKLQYAQEQGRMAREKMQQDRLAAEAQAKQAAELQDKQNATLTEFTKLAGSGDVQGAHAMVPLLSRMGVPVSLEGEQNGLPRYRIGPDPEEAARGAGAIGYPTDDTGTLDEPMGIGSSADMTPEQIARVTGGGTEQRAATEQAVAQEPLAVEPDMGPPAADADTDLNPIKPEFQRAAQALDPLASMRPSSLGPKPAAEPDYTGAVPRNVIDMGAMHAQTLASLDPALKSVVASYPEAFRESAGQTAEAVKSLPLGSVKGLDMMKSLRSSPDSIINAQVAADAQKGQSDVKAQGLADKESNRRHERGFSIVGKEAGNKYQMDDLLDRRRTRELGLYVLTNKDSKGNYDVGDDHLAGAQISRMMGERGSTTEPDIQRVLGDSAVSFIQSIKRGAYKEAFGGLEPAQRATLVKLLSESVAADKRKAFEFMDNLESLAAEPDTDPDTAHGMRDYIRIAVPKDWRDEYAASKKKKAAPGASPAASEAKPFNMEQDANQEFGRTSAAVDGDFDTELKRQADEAGLNYAALKHVMTSPVESGGNAAAVNPKSGATGLIQFMPSIAKGLGTSTEELKKMSPTEQIQYAIKYYKDRGMNAEHDAEDYYVVTAAGATKDGKPVFVGKPDGTVVYKKDSAGWRDNPLWRPADDGDITVGGLKRYSRSGRATEKAATAAAVDPKTRLAELRKKKAEG